MAANGTGTFDNDHAAQFVNSLLSVDHAAASNSVTAALRSVEEAGDTLSGKAADEGRVAVALLLAEQQPSVLDEAPEQDRLRGYLRDLDTELTPSRRTLAEAVLNRIVLSEANDWYAGWTDPEQRNAAVASVRQLADLLEDG